jgi:hypothetical protein
MEEPSISDVFRRSLWDTSRDLALYMPTHTAVLTKLEEFANETEKDGDFLK